MSDSLFISAYLLFALIIITLIIFFIWRLRRADFLIKTNMPSFLKCAILWAAIVAFICLGFSLLAIDLDLLFSDMNNDGSLTKSALNLNKELIYPVPLAAIFGAAFGALFYSRRLKDQTSVLKRGLVGAGLGLFIFLSFCTVLLLSPLNTDNDSYARGMLLYAVIILSSLLPMIITLALLTPKQCLGKK